MSLNAVERRLLNLRYSWDGFTADPVPRLLVWTAPDAAMRLVRCFFEAQKHEGEYVTGDLFVHFDTPFDNSIQYSRALKKALAGQYAASSDELAEQGLGSVWNADIAAFPDSAYGLTQALRSFGGAYHQTIGHLVAVFAPVSVSSDAHFAAWLARTLDAGLPERLRLVAMDSLEVPRLADMQPVNPLLVQRETLALDATAIATETFAQERTVGPAGVFRSILMAMVALVEKGSAAQVQLKAADAIGFVREQGWRDQEAVVSMLVAGALLKERRFEAATVAYRDARAMATLAAEEGHPAGLAMVLHSWFGEASVELAVGRVTKAAVAYDHATVIAQQAGNTILTIEAFRMGAFCHARLSERDAALDRGFQALTIGEGLRPAARIMTSLPIAATDLLRVLDPDRVEEIEAIRTRAKDREQVLADMLEQHAVAHERNADPRVFNAAEETFSRETKAVAGRAAQELMALVGSAGAPFRQAFLRARAVLGSGWPPVSTVSPELPAPVDSNMEATSA